METFPWWGRAWLLLLRSVFLETSDGVLSSISSMPDSCQKKQIEYLATLREGIQHSKHRPVSAGAGIGFTRAPAHGFWLPCVSQRCGPGEGDRNDQRCGRAAVQGRHGIHGTAPFPWGRIDRWVKWEKRIDWNYYWCWFEYWYYNDMTHKAGIMDSMAHEKNVSFRAI